MELQSLLNGLKIILTIPGGISIVPYLPINYQSGKMNV